MTLIKTLSSIILLSSLLVGCNQNNDDNDGNDDNTIPNNAVIVGPTSDRTAASMSIINSSDISEVTTELNASANTDVAISSFKNIIYRLERYGANNITKFTITHPETAIWQCSTEGEDTNSNPYQLIQVSETKAYVLRYGTGKIWIIDPSIADSSQCETAFKTGEIDLSSTDIDADGIPNMSSAVLVGDNLFVSLQILDGYQPVNDSKVAVIDTLTDTLIDTDESTAGTQLITLIGKNPNKMVYSSALDKLFVQSVGRYASSYAGTAAEYSGGIDQIDPTTFTVTQVIDDTLSTTQQISSMSIINESIAYMVGYAGYKNNTLYQFNPSTGKVEQDETSALKAIAGFSNTNIQNITKGPNDTLWLTIESGVAIINTIDNTVISSLVDTKMNPSGIVFVSE